MAWQVPVVVVVVMVVLMRVDGRRGISRCLGYRSGECGVYIFS